MRIIAAVMLGLAAPPTVAMAPAQATVDDRAAATGNQPSVLAPLPVISMSKTV